MLTERNTTGILLADPTREGGKWLPSREGGPQGDRQALAGVPDGCRGQDARAKPLLLAGRDEPLPGRAGVSSGSHARRRAGGLASRAASRLREEARGS